MASQTSSRNQRSWVTTSSAPAPRRQRVFTQPAKVIARRARPAPHVPVADSTLRVVGGRGSSSMSTSQSPMSQQRARPARGLRLDRPVDAGRRKGFPAVVPILLHHEHGAGKASRLPKGRRPTSSSGNMLAIALMGRPAPRSPCCSIVKVVQSVIGIQISIALVDQPSQLVLSHTKARGRTNAQISGWSSITLAVVNWLPHRLGRGLGRLETPAIPHVQYLGKRSTTGPCRSTILAGRRPTSSYSGNFHRRSGTPPRGVRAVHPPGGQRAHQPSSPPAPSYRRARPFMNIVSASDALADVRPQRQFAALPGKRHHR